MLSDINLENFEFGKIYKLEVELLNFSMLHQVEALSLVFLTYICIALS